jgi:hypothetical protein
VSISQQAASLSLADALASDRRVVPAAGLDCDRAFRRIQLTAIQGAFDAELDRLKARRESHALLVSAHRRRETGDALAQQRLFAEVDRVLANFSDYLPEFAAPAPRAPRD